MNTPESSNAPSQADLQGSLRQAMTRHEQGDLSTADTLYARFLQQQPEHAQALRLRGALARERGDADLSLQLLDRAVQVAPRSPAALAERALTRIARGELQAAEHDLRAAGELAPDNTDVLTNLGALLQHRGHVRAACEVYRRVLALNADDTEVRCNLACALADAGDTSAALAEAHTALQRSGGHPAAAATIGTVLLHQSRHADALAALAPLVQAEQADDMTLVNYALCVTELGDAAEARRALQQALERNPWNARACADLVNVLSGAGDDAAALEVAERFLAAHPDERLVLGSYAQALLNAGDSARALPLLDCDSLVQVIDFPDRQAAASLNAALAEALLADPSRLANPVSKATTGGEQTGELDLQKSGPLQAFAEFANTAVTTAIERYRATGLHTHPVLRPGSDRWQLRAWGTVLHSDGQQRSHMHPLGWLSAVYYVAVPAGMAAGGEFAGQLQFGLPPERVAQHRPAPLRHYAPQPGRLILFPSWFWHRTVPFQAPTPRISIAFDVMSQSRLLQM